MGRVEGKAAVVTGAAKGIGREIALLFAREGAKVAVTDVDGERNQVAEEIAREGGTGKAFFLDVSQEDQVASVFAAAANAFGKIDVLVNNAGIAGSDLPPDQTTAEDWNRVMAVNVNGVFFCTKHVIPYMRRAGGGSIVHLSSIYGIVGAPDAPAYHASKGAVRLMAKTEALFYATDNIRVNSVHPGFIWTPMVEGFLRGKGDVQAGRKALDALHPLGHMGEPEDVAYGVLYLASDESKFVTGSELVIDGGYTAR